MTTETQTERPIEFSKAEVIAYAEGIGLHRTHESMTRNVQHVYGWIEREKSDAMHLLKDHLKGKMVVDVHCGRPEQIKIIADFVRRCGASGYNGVDDHLLPQAAERQITFSDDFILFYSDLALRHLANMPDRYGPVCINGVSSTTYPNYPLFLTQEIARVAGKNIVFGFGSSEVFSELRKRDFKDILDPKLAGLGFSFGILKREE